MNQNKITGIILVLGLMLVVGSVYLMTAPPVKAQCGSQASSCKNCHETQAQDPVNNDGTDWHTQHAFGDFCYLCHGGNNQATDEGASHTGMVSPLADINTSCKSCHPNDTLVKAQIYATTLGQEVGTGGTTISAPPSQGTTSSAPSTTEFTPTAQSVVVPSVDMVDYSQRYDAIVLEKKPVNTGNIILVVILAAIVLGGGFFVLKREGWINIYFEDPKRVPVQKKYPADVVELLPNLSRLKPASRQILGNILTKPQVAADLLSSIDKLAHVDPPGIQTTEDQKE